MDPDENLAELRRIAARVIDDSLPSTGKDAFRDAVRMAELFEALDGWISGQGFLPKAWAKGRK